MIPDIIEKLPAIFSLMQEMIEAEDGLRYIEAVLRYISVRWIYLIKKSEM